MSNTTGAKAPTAAQQVSEAPWSDDAWQTPQNIYGTGTASVTASSFDAGDQTWVLKAYNFDFSAIPDTAVITGVSVIINGWYANAPASIDLCQLLNVSRAKVGTNLAGPTAFTTSAANYTFGGNNNLWGNALTASWVKNANFGVAIGCLAGGSGNNNVDVFIDVVTMEVFFVDTLVLSDGSQTQTADNQTLSYLTSITINSASQSASSDNLTIGTNLGVLTVADASQSQSADSLNLVSSGEINLAPEDAQQLQEVITGTPEYIYLVDESGNYIIDDSGNYIISGSTDVLELSLSATSAEIQDGSQAQTSDNVSLSYLTGLTVADATQTQTASDAIVLSRTAVLSVEDGSQVQTADNVSGMSTGQNLSVDNATQDQTSDTLTLTALYLPITVADASQAQTCDAITSLIRNTTLSVADATQTQTADGVDSVGILVAANATQSQSADAVDLTKTWELAVADAAQSQASDEAVLIGLQDIVPSDGVQVQTSDGIDLTRLTYLAVDGASQAQSASNADLEVTYQSFLTVADAHQSQAAGNVTMSFNFTLGVNDARQGQNAQDISFAPSPISVPPSKPVPNKYWYKGAFAGTLPWLFTEQWDKPHYNEGVRITSSPTIGGSPVWNMTNKEFGDTPITPHEHDPWCGYWTKERSGVTPSPSPVTPSYLFVGTSAGIIKMDPETLAILYVYSDNGADSLSTGEDGFFYGATANKVQRYEAINDIILRNQSAAVASPWNTFRRLCFDGTNVYGVGCAGGGVNVTGASFSGADASIITTHVYTDPSSIANLITSSDLYWNPDRNCSYCVANHNGSTYLYEFDTSMVLSSKIAIARCVTGTDAKEYIAYTRNADAVQPINTNYIYYWVLADADAIKDTVAWVNVSPIYLGLQASWNAVEGKYTIGTSTSFMNQIFNVDPDTGAMTGFSGYFDPTWAVLAASNGFIYTNDQTVIRKYSHDGSYTGVSFTLPLAPGTVGGDYSSEMYEFEGSIYVWGRYSIINDWYVYRLNPSSLALQATSPDLNSSGLSNAQPLCITGITT